MNSLIKHSSRTSKPRISFANRSLFSIENKIFQDYDTAFIQQPDFVTWFIKSKKVIDPESTSIPVVKERLANGYRIVDLRLGHVKDSLKLIRSCMEMDPLCASLELLTDPDSLKLMDYILLRKIADWCSFCAIHEGTGKLVGVIIGSLKSKNDQERTETRIRPNQGQSLFYLMTLNSCLMSKSQVYESLNVDNYLRIYALCVEENHKGKGVGLALIRTFIDKSKELKVSVCVGVFVPGAALTIVEYALGRKLGFNELKTILYKDALIPGDEDPFSNSTVKNYKLYCMALSLQLPTEAPALDVESPIPKARKEKKKIRKH